MEVEENIERKGPNNNAFKYKQKYLYSIDLSATEVIYELFSDPVTGKRKITLMLTPRQFNELTKLTEMQFAPANAE